MSKENKDAGNVQTWHRVRITMPRDRKADRTFLKLGILLSNEKEELSSQETEEKSNLLFKWLTALIDCRILKRLGELLVQWPGE